MALLGALILIGALASISISFYSHTESNALSINQARTSLNSALETLQEEEDLLRYHSYELTDGLNSWISDTSLSRYQIYQFFKNKIPTLHTVTVFKNAHPWIWAGDNQTRYQSFSNSSTSAADSQLFIDPADRLLVYRTELDDISNDSVAYTLQTSRILPSQFELQTSPLPSWYTEPKPKQEVPRLQQPTFRIRMAINYVPSRDSLLLSAPIALHEQDSIGVAYVPPYQLTHPPQQIPSLFRWFNLALLLLGILILISAGWNWSFTLSKWATLIARLGIWLVLSILIFSYYQAGDQLITLPALTLTPAQTQLLRYLTLALLSAGVSTTIISRLYFIRRLYGFTWYPRTIVVSLLFGTFSAISLLGLIHLTIASVQPFGLQVFSLNVLPNLQNLLLQLGAGILWGALLALITTLSWFLFNSEQDQLDWVPPFVAAGFLSTLLLYYLLIQQPLHDIILALTVTTGGMIFCSIIGYSLHKHPLRWRFISRARFYAMAIFFVSLGSYILFSHAASIKLKQSLKLSADQAAALPVGAEQAIASFVGEVLERDLESERLAYGGTAYPLETQLRRELSEQTSLLEDRYIIQAFILADDDQVLATASTGLSSLTFDEIQTLVYENGQQDLGGIQNGNNHSGWSQREINQGTLLTYVETRHSERELPLYSAMQSDSIRSDVFTPPTVQLIAYYQDGELALTESRGNTHTFPIQQTLTKNFQKPQWGKKSTEHGNFLTYAYPIPSTNQAIVSYSKKPSIQQHLYLFFRYYFVLLISGLIILQLLSWLDILEASIYRKNERFRNRIIDSYMIASLAFLVILTIATHLIMQRQQRNQVEQQVLETLDQLSETLDSDLSTLSDQQLLRLSSPFEVDALLYHKAQLKHTTYPEMVEQGLFASLIPYDVFHQLFTEQQKQTVHLQPLPDEQNDISLLYSYQRLSNDSNWVLAIPSLLDRSRINDEIVQTITYLLVIYIFIFGLFMFSAAIIARELTRPLLYFQSGLKRISEGKLDTTIPVTTQDEIGSLAHAYNVMVYKLKDLQKELAEAERQAAWTEMARQVAHEIKNPLTPMKLQIQHLKRLIGSGQYTLEELKPKANQITSNLVDQMQSLSNIASDFSRFAKPFKSDLQKLDLNKLLKDIDQLYEHDERIHIEADLAQVELPVLAAEDELKRVFINLVKNASEAMPHGGVIILRSYKHKEQAFVDVVDNGKGISEDHKAKIFVPNFSTKTSGTGLGLAISKKIIEAHHGEIDFASVPGSGTTFTIEIPLNGFH
jgi:signal transduction histidine kinase